MSKCATFSCYLQNLKNSKNLGVKEPVEEETMMKEIDLARKPAHGSPENGENMTPDPSTFRIMFPIIMVIAVIVVIAVAFLLHRLISSAMWNNWDSNEEPQNWNTHGRFRRRRDDIRTVSSYVDVPPTYRQVMKTMKHEIQPPTYNEVMTGSVNCGFVPESDISVIRRDPDHFDSIDIDDDAEKGNTNCLIQSRITSTPKADGSRYTVVLHGRGLVPTSETLFLRDDPPTEENLDARHHSPTGPRSSSGSAGTVTSSVTVVDVIAVEPQTDDEADQSDREADDVICSSV